VSVAAGGEPADLGAWVEKLEEQCRREAMEIRLRGIADAEEESAKALAAANGLVERRIERIRELRDALAADGARIERDLARAAKELKRRGDTIAADSSAAGTTKT
jgi:hypothetical protein